MGALLTLRTGNDGTLAYDDFLSEKVAFDRKFGFDVDDAQISPALLPHQRAIVKWAVRGGRRAIFARYGLGKSVMQLEILRLILARIEESGANANALVVAPLGVRGEFIRDGRNLLGLEVRFIRRTEEIAADWHGIYVTNYESVRDGRLDVSIFDAVSLDEAAVLRSFGSKTYQEFLGMFAEVPFRFVATATPSPNRHKELIHYAGFLGIMDTGAALTRFFKRDPSKAGNLQLHPHKVREFWLWLNTWACFLQRPSDLGFSDEGYDLPPLNVQWHQVEIDMQSDQVERDGQGVLVRGGALSMVDAAREKRNTLPARVAQTMEIVDAYFPRSQTRVHAELPGTEQGTAERSSSSEVPPRPGSAGQSDRPGAPLARREPGEVQGAIGPCGQGEGQSALVGVVSVEPGARGSDSSPKQAEARVRDDGRGVRQPSDSAGRMLRDLRDGNDEPVRGPRSRYGDGARSPMHDVQLGSRNVQGQPDETDGSRGVSDQLIIWVDLNDEQDAVEKALSRRGISYSSVHGSLSDDEIERRLEEWREQRTTVLIGKPVQLGQGMNFQQCNKCVWVGVTYKFEQTIQSLHRVQRFGQARPVEAHFIFAESETEVRSVLEAKWREHDQLTDTMSDVLREFGLNPAAISAELTRAMGVERKVYTGDNWTIALNDSVVEARDYLTPESVGLIVTSIPFGNHYEYSPNYADMGHTDGNGHFWWGMDYLTPSLYSCLQPGRILAVHVKDRQLFGSVTGAGVYTVSPFHAEAIAHYTGHGFDYYGMITVTTDVVRENAQTYRLSYTKMLKDHTPMGVGSPEYVLLFHKPQSNRAVGWADERVTKDKADYSVGRWQIDAAAEWRESGDRLLSVDELAQLDPETRTRLFTKQSLGNVYDYDEHVRLAEALLAKNALPGSFASLNPGSWRPDVWHDILRIDTLNSEQKRRDVENHICPFPLGIPRRLIDMYSNPGDLVYDPFGGIGSTALTAVEAGRRAYSSELNPASLADSLVYLRRHDDRAAVPTLFDLLEMDGAA